MERTLADLLEYLVDKAPHTATGPVVEPEQVDWLLRAADPTLK